MSDYFALICPETKKRIHIGNGPAGSGLEGRMHSFFSGDPHIMERLKDFLNDHIGKDLKVVNMDFYDDEVYKFEDYMYI